MNKLSSSAVTTTWLAILLIVIDQLTKYWANTSLTLGEPMAILPHLNLTLVYNYGAAFSFLSEVGGWQRWFFTVLALIVGTALVIWLAKLPKRWTLEVVAINLVLSGAIGNVIDRILAGRVTDFVDFYIGSWHYATFNVADMGISIGAVLLIISEFWLKPRREKKAQSTEESV
ncbi:Lipoprotein signal peptidase [Hydrogenovibrio crunogenus]|uniref:Lipoprotein signal peptidase n=1 Tax=Hydrogenovibrio crunogenus TaxID=39765 RepID=A0A4P7NXV9_9GAMM|nr:signal peptidase II [Hydrogenovibrio crunogenus]QBZ82496.1 Lipoprotein signal peptidase [Hydrogenovibrio crunogenus]